MTVYLSTSLSIIFLFVYLFLMGMRHFGTLTACTSTLPPRRMAMPSLSVVMTISEGWPRAADTWSSTISATPRLARRAWWNKSFCFSNSCSCRQGESDLHVHTYSLPLNFFYLIQLDCKSVVSILFILQPKSCTPWHDHNPTHSIPQIQRLK